MAAEEVRNFEDTVKVMKMALTLSGIDTSSKPKNWISKFFFRHCVFFLELLWVHSVVMSEIFWIIEGVQIGKSIIELATIAPCAVGCFMITFKAFYIYWNGDILNDILNRFQLLHPEFDNSDSSAQIEKGIVTKSQKLLQLVVMVLLGSTIVVFVAYTFLPVISMVQKYLQTGEINLQFPLSIKYFFDPFTLTRFPFLYLHQIIATFFVCMNLLASETTYFALCTNLTMHFKLLSQRFKTVKYSQYEVNQKQILVDLIKRHQELIELCGNMERLYAKPNLGHILLSSVLICLSGFSVAFNEEFVAVFTFTFFLISILSQVFFLCFFGDMIIHSSTEVGEAVYESLWYNADPKSKKTLLLVLIRAQVPCKLTAAGFGDIDLLTFTTILSRSWSYFALLQTMFD